MKILIACDEKNSAEKIYCDLQQAALPAETEVFVLSVADVFFVPEYKGSKYDCRAGKTYLDHVNQELKKARAVVKPICKKLKAKFPQWHFHAEVAAGSPAWEIVDKAKKWKVDLIVMGSHGRIGAGEFFFGSVVLRVLSEADCSVRIVRGEIEKDDRPSRIIVGVDGSPDSEAAINCITARKWKEGSCAHLITSINAAFYTAFLSDDNLARKGNPKAWIKKMHVEYRTKLEKAGLIGYSLIEEGDPKVILLQEASDWHSDCIFVGAKGHSRLDRFLTGSVSSAIAARAHCTVEIIRNRDR